MDQKYVDCNRSESADKRHPSTLISRVKRVRQFSVQMHTSALRTRKFGVTVDLQVAAGRAPKHPSYTKDMYLDFFFSSQKNHQNISYINMVGSLCL